MFHFNQNWSCNNFRGYLKWKKRLNLIHMICKIIFMLSKGNLHWWIDFKLKALNKRIRISLNQINKKPIQSLHLKKTWTLKLWYLSFFNSVYSFVRCLFLQLFYWSIYFYHSYNKEKRFSKKFSRQDIITQKNRFYK